MDEFENELLNGHLKEKNIVEQELSDPEEEGEIRDEDELSEAEDIGEIFGGGTSIDGYIDKLLKLTDRDVENNYFDDLILGNTDSFEGINDNLADIDEKSLLNGAIKDRYEMRNVPCLIDSDTDEDSESLEDIDIPAIGSIIDSMLDDKSKSKPAEKTKKGRIVDKEAELEYLLPVDLEARLSGIEIAPSDELEVVGSVIQRIEGTQAVTVLADRPDPILDISTVIFDTHKRLVGIVDNIFGCRQQPLYLIVCKDVGIWASLKPGEKLMVAPKVRNAYFTAVETHELIDHDDNSEPAFSDDEKEEEHRRKQAGLNSSKKRKQPRKKPNKNSTHYNQQQNRNPFRSVNRQPFDTSRPPPAPFGAMPMMMPPSNPMMMGAYYGAPVYPPFGAIPGQMNPYQFSSYQQFCNQRPPPK